MVRVPICCTALFYNIQTRDPKRVKRKKNRHKQTTTATKRRDEAVRAHVLTRRLKKNDTYYEGEYSRDMSEKEREREWRKK